MSHVMKRELARRNAGRHDMIWSMRITVLPLLAASFIALAALQPSRSLAASTPCDCESCHSDPHGANWQGCSGCHQSPPSTGSHLAHYDDAPSMTLRYGDTEVHSTAGAYKFGCGNCHPLDRVKHRDGTVEVELYDPAAPPGSIKANNPPEAAYDPTAHTCANVYCHSGYSVTSGVVGLPLTSPSSPVPPGYQLNGSYVMDETCSNLTYDPYTVEVTRTYTVTPMWGTSGTFTTCTECHAFPLTTYYPAVQAGVGDSHQWVDDWGWNWRHAFNMSSDPLPCRTCHYNTVTQAGATRWTTGENGASIIAYDPVSLASRAAHVNGTPDVAFDTVDPVIYFRNDVFSLAGATYDPATKTCSDVICHYNPAGPIRLWQKKVRWGGPWRDEHESGAECDVCHRMGYLNETCTPPQ